LVSSAIRITKTGLVYPPVRAGSGSRPSNVSRYNPVTVANGRTFSLSMILLPVMFVFVLEFFELLDDLIVFSNFLVDGKQQGIQREHGPKHNPQKFRVHNVPYL